ncbi:single-stranded DNA-binding protein [Kitasatospora sp. DSM 101779]|uniref:single-stranded DNA-binding protein n=1 Tax=Kitasatospora sp. DSM 101779 TaxID=2853165 RepID=UPI0021DB09D3|nr:single-stranded DNA-binding protein [Kitasatospora sp. DSM 101779]MCU7822489.1 single-stranded DNA-binding protein [Kitasatospora sp. DSM 101779]
MNETLVTIVGNVASTVTYAQTPAGVPVANFRMATTERRFDRGTGDWIDGETTWVTVVAWRWLATNLVSSVNKGDPVVVSGRLRVREWGEEDRRRTAVEIDARSVGHDLSRGTSAFRWAVRGRADQEKGGSDAVGPPDGRRAGEPAPVGEAVPEWIVAAVEARRAAERATSGAAATVGPVSPSVLAGAAGGPGTKTG